MKRVCGSLSENWLQTPAAALQCADSQIKEFVSQNFPLLLLQRQTHWLRSQELNVFIFLFICPSSSLTRPSVWKIYCCQSRNSTFSFLQEATRLVSVNKDNYRSVLRRSQWKGSFPMVRPAFRGCIFCVCWQWRETPAPPAVQPSRTDAPAGPLKCTFSHLHEMSALLFEPTPDRLRICQSYGVCYITGRRTTPRSAERWRGHAEQSCEAVLLLDGVRWRSDSLSSLLSDCFQTDLHPRSMLVCLISDSKFWCVFWWLLVLCGISLILIAALIRALIYSFFLFIAPCSVYLGPQTLFGSWSWLSQPSLLQASEEASLLVSSPRMLLPAAGALPPGAPLSVHHQIQLLQQQLQQQQQQTQVAVAQVTFTHCFIHVTHTDVWVSHGAKNGWQSHPAWWTIEWENI